MPTYSSSSLPTSCEKVILNLIRIKCISVLPVIVLYLFLQSLNSSYSCLFVLVLMIRQLGAFVFSRCVLLALRHVLYDLNFSAFKVCSWPICCCINVSSCCTCALVAQVFTRISEGRRYYIIVMAMCRQFSLGEWCAMGWRCSLVDLGGFTTTLRKQDGGDGDWCTFYVFPLDILI